MDSLEDLQTGQMAGIGVPGPWAEALAGEPSSQVQLYSEGAR